MTQNLSLKAEKSTHLFLISAFLALVTAFDHRTAVAQDYRGKWVSSTSVLSESAQELQARVSQVQVFVGAPLPPVRSSIKYYQIVYRTQDARGNWVDASGLVVIPDSPKAGPAPEVIYQHGTITQTSQAPSKSYLNSEAQAISTLFAGAGYVTVFADYLGYGASEGIHPYLHAQTEASAAADLAIAADEFAQSKGIQISSQVAVAGYSQGGHAALALSRFLESEANHTGKTVYATIGMAGPYDLNSSMMAMINTPQDASSARGVLYTAFALIGLNEASPFCKEMSELVRDPYDKKLSALFNGKNSGQEIQLELPNSVSGLLTDHFRTELINGSHPFNEVLKKNNVYDYVPKSPVLLIHSKGDDLVPYQNMETAFEYFKEAGANVEKQDLLGDPSHVGGALQAFVRSYLWVIQQE